MKINGIKALDYQCQGDSLTLVLSETTFDAVSNLNTALIEVRTDDGDLVEAHGGYALRAITYDKDKQTYADACAAYLKNCEYKEFFVSGIYNVLADRGAKVAGFATDLHLPFGTPAEYRAAEAPENKSAFEELL